MDTEDNGEIRTGKGGCRPHKRKVNFLKGGKEKQQFSWKEVKSQGRDQKKVKVQRFQAQVGAGSRNNAITASLA